MGGGVSKTRISPETFGRAAKSAAFTLAEALITLGIIGVVAAVTIPAVIVNVNGEEYKTGLRKAVSSLNDAVTLNIAIDGKKPNDINYGYISGNASASNYSAAAYLAYFRKHMRVLRSTTKMPGSTDNAGFYTADGMRYEIPGTSLSNIRPKTSACGLGLYFNLEQGYWCSSPNYAKIPNTGLTCPLVVDVNGDKGPNQNGVDKFLLLFNNDIGVVPFGCVAQKLLTGDEN